MYTINPLTDPRWPQFVADHPQASIFHTREWLNALRLAYGYKPVAFTTHQGSDLSDAVLFCEVQSWLTGKRLVSLPFSDHCEPLADTTDLQEILHYLHKQREKQQFRYIELRPALTTGILNTQDQFTRSERFCFHVIDLRSELENIYQNLHSNCVRRKIKRAEREELTYESGHSEELLQKFRHLLLLTRRRHQLPPQPSSWFHNVLRCLGNLVTIHVVSKETMPVASILTLTYKSRMVYKYGCSDTRFNAMGGTSLLFWKAIQQAHSMGIEEFDLGRSSYNDPGLIAFKNHLGAALSELSYYRNPSLDLKPEQNKSRISSLSRQVLAHLPDPLFAGVGQLLYRHMG
ncbi:MAG TPA: GNAT family N-acetyltransferase [Edaphobacter sp.]|nr:GNAT family N-acetyltransferase [Edaphobacter sp.]